MMLGWLPSVRVVASTDWRIRLGAVDLSGKPSRQKFEFAMIRDGLSAGIVGCDIWYGKSITAQILRIIVECALDLW